MAGWVGGLVVGLVGLVGGLLVLLAETDRLLAEGAKRVRYPPARSGSPLLGLWEKHMLTREEIEREVPKMSREQEAELVRKITAMRKAAEPRR